MLRGAVFASAALALTLAPIAAQAAPAPRTAAAIDESEQVRGTTLWLVIAVILGGLAIIFWDDLFGDDEPSSP